MRIAKFTVSSIYAQHILSLNICWLMKLVDDKHFPKLDRQRAKDLGLRFLAERTQRNLSIQDVADKLLLSRQQVQGLESGEPQYFYGVKLFAQVADKYAELLGLLDRPSSYIVVHADHTENVQTTIDDKSSSESLHQMMYRSQFMRFGLFIIMAIALLGALYQYNSTPDSKIANPRPAGIHENVTENLEQQPAAPSPDNSATKITPDPKTGVGSDSTSNVTIQLRFSDTCWVQVVDSKGKKLDKTYHSGDTLELPPIDLKALIIGNSKAVSVSDSASEISLKPYVQEGSNVARIFGESLRSFK